MRIHNVVECWVTYMKRLIQTFIEVAVDILKFSEFEEMFSLWEFARRANQAQCKWKSKSTPSTYENPLTTRQALYLSTKPLPADLVRYTIHIEPTSSPGEEEQAPKHYSSTRKNIIPPWYHPTPVYHEPLKNFVDHLNVLDQLDWNRWNDDTKEGDSGWKVLHLQV